MSNTDTIEYAKVTKHTSWQEVVPFLRTDDIVAVRFREGEPEHIAKVWVSRDTTRIMAGARFLRYTGGRFNARVADVVLHSVCVQTNDLEPLAASLKAGDVVRATFVYAGSSAATLEGTVLTDEDGDALLVVEDEDGGSPEVYYLTFFGRIADTLRALEVIAPDEGGKHTTWQDLVPLLRTGDIVTVHTTGMIELGGPVWRDAESLCITAGSRIIRRADGTLNSDVTDVVLHFASGRADELEPLAASLNAGDVVRAVFIEQDAIGNDRVVTREGPVMLDADGDPVMEPYTTCEVYHLTLYGIPVSDLFTLEVIAPAEGGKEIIEDITREDHDMDMRTPEGRLAVLKATPLGTKVSATHEGRQFEGALALDADGDYVIDMGGHWHLWLADDGISDMDVQDITFHEDKSAADTPKAPSWVDVLPFLVTGDVVTVHVSGIPPTRDATVTVDPDGTIVAGPRFLRYRGGAPGDYIENVILEELGQPASTALRDTVDSLKVGDIVRATFLTAIDHDAPVATVEGPVNFDCDGDRFIYESRDDDPGWLLSVYGVTYGGLRALEVLSRAGDTSEPEDVTPDDFQRRALTTAVYPGAGTFWGLQYATGGLSNEAGEVLGKVKKMQRDKGYKPESVILNATDREDLRGELGDVAWYLAVAAYESDLTLSEVFDGVLAKLADRADRGVLGGSGDTR